MGSYRLSVTILAQMDEDWSAPPLASSSVRPPRTRALHVEVSAIAEFPEGIGGRDDFEHKQVGSVQCEM